MKNIATSWEDDDIGKDVLERLKQYEPTEKELAQLAEDRKGEVVTIGELLGRIADYAEKYVDELTIHSRDMGQQRENPLEGEPPYEMSNASFVYWCYRENKIELSGGDLEHTTRTIRNSERLGELYGVGSNVNLDSLLRGDILFFNNDRHMGIYVGDGEFVSMDGPANKHSSGGVNRHKLDDGYWKSVFRGHVRRLIR